MEAAITAAQRGHDVTLVEKQDHLGGNLIPAGSAYFKGDYLELAKVLEKRVYENGVHVQLNTEVTSSYIKGFDPDALFVAIGSKECNPPIPGLDSDKVIMAIDAELHPEKLGKKVVIMGGGLVGCEGAIGWHHEGHDCTIIEMKPEVAMECNSFYRGGLLPRIYDAATVMCNTSVKAVTEEGVLVCDADGKESVIEADSVVCALGFKSEYEKVDALSDIVDEYYIIGDCQKVGKVYDAMSTAYYAACRV